MYAIRSYYEPFMKINAKVLICYNSPVSIFSVYNGKPVKDINEGNDLSEKSFLKEFKNIKRILSKNYTEVEALAINKNIQKTINGINSFKPDIIYNFVESVEGITSRITSYNVCYTKLLRYLNSYLMR